MKKITVAIGIVCVIALAGCAKLDLSEQKPVDGVAVVPEETQTPIEEIKPIASKIATYEDWQIVLPAEMRKYYDSDESFWNYMLAFPWPFSEARTDCLGMTNGETYGGDLLSSLIVNDKLRNAARLKVYSTDYLKSLERKTSNYTQTTEKSDFYAFSVCNLGNGFDVTAGYLWPTGKTTDRERLHDAQKILLLANNGKVYGFKNIQTINNTATGGEVGPCNATLKSRNLEWSCFTGLGHEPNGQGGEKTFGQYKNWLISSDGKILKSWDSRD